jgi:hypothetical protein
LAHPPAAIERANTAAVSTETGFLIFILNRR